nr:hypothetical protein [Rhodococcus sp. (in: high G+C Gram-positive bacteria)]
MASEAVPTTHLQAQSPATAAACSRMDVTLIDYALLTFRRTVSLPFGARTVSITKGL